MINKNKAFTYFSNNFNISYTTKGWYAFKCPFCSDLRDRKKAAVHFKYNSVKCWVCGHKSSIIDFVMAYEDVKYFDAKDIINNCSETSVDLTSSDKIAKTTKQEVKLPEGYTPISEGDTIMGRRARQYLLNRGFDLEEMDRLGIGYCRKKEPNSEVDFFGYIIIPFKRKGGLVYYIGRDYIGNFLRYKNPPTTEFNVGKSELVFNEDALDLYDECQVLEGWADAVTIGRTATATQGWNLSAIQKKIYIDSSCKRLVFIPDAGADNTGELFYHKALKLANEFLEYKDEVYVLDLNGLEGGKDVNELGKEAIHKLRAEAEPLTTESILKILMGYGGK